MINSKFSIAIIGGGASGTTLAIQLLKKFKTTARVILIEKDNSLLHRGVAYSSALSYEPLNVPVSKMSIYAEQPTSFFDYVRHNKLAQVEMGDYVSRRWFGDYLVAQMADAVAQKNDAVCFEKVIDEVLDISVDENNDYTIKTRLAAMQHINLVVLATGNNKPESFAIEGEVPKGYYFDHPWSFDTAKVEAQKKILVIGTGLTMVDIAGSFFEQNYDGHILAISRKGLLPKVHAEHATASNIDLPTGTSLHEWLAAVRSNIKLLNAQQKHWSVLMDAIRPHTVSIWRNFSAQEKNRFLRKLKPIWELHRHRMPTASKAIIDKLIAQKKLTIVAAQIEKIKWVSGRNSFDVAYIDANKNVTIDEVHYIVNATGPSGNINSSQQHFFGNLLAKKWLTPDENRLGVLTDEEGRLVGETKHLYAIGSLRKAAEWESTAMREISQQAEKMAQLIVLHQSERI